MYRSYTKFFRIFGAMIIFLQISKDSALFKNQKITKAHCSSSSASLTAWAHCQRHNEITAALPSPAGRKMRRR